MGEIDLKEIDYCEESFHILATFSAILDATLKDASNDDKYKSICVICEMLLTGYLAKLSFEDRKHWVGMVYEGVLHLETLKSSKSSNS